jgi:hypothetical protein
MRPRCQANLARVVTPVRQIAGAATAARECASAVARRANEHAGRAQSVVGRRLAGSFRSPAAASTPGGRWLCPADLVSARTGCPAAASVLTSSLPLFPAEPVTRIIRFPPLASYWGALTPAPLNDAGRGRASPDHVRSILRITELLPKVAYLGLHVVLFPCERPSQGPRLRNYHPKHRDSWGNVGNSGAITR